MVLSFLKKVIVNQLINELYVIKQYENESK